MYYVYILLCSDGKHYIGLTRDIRSRLKNHNAGLSFSTKYRLPVKLKCFIAFPSRNIAVSFEQYLKSGSGNSFFKKHLV